MTARIDLKLGTLALHGVPQGQAGVLVAAMKAELQRRLADPRTVAALVSAGPSHRARFDAGRFNSSLAGAGVASSSSATADGTRVAAAIHNGLVRTRVAPGGRGVRR